MKRELTVLSIGLGLLLGIIMAAANVYLGLYAGMTVSASIPCSVLAMGIYKALKKDSFYEINVVQTMASTGESLAAGVIFTIPALLIVGIWNEFAFWPTTLIAACGGVLGVVFMVPLRKALIEDDKTLIYPEGVACAQVLRAGALDKSGVGFKSVLQGLGIGAAFKAMVALFGVFKGSVEKAMFLGKAPAFMGADISPALLAVGYIVGLPISLLVLLGGSLAWLIAIPVVALGRMNITPETNALDLAWELWSTEVRYIGVGAMVVGGLWSLIGVRKSFVSGVKALANSGADRKDLSPTVLGVLLLVNIVIMAFLYHHLIGSWGISLLTTVAMVIASFLFVAVSSYVVGLVGTSNNPVSGMTISALLGTSAFFLVFGFHGESAILATLGVAGVVCCAACTAGDTSQDLKTGAILGASPRALQIAQLLGAAVPALILAPTLTLLHQAYGIGQQLKAPQATLFASLTKAIFSNGTLPMDKIWIGAALGVAIIVLDHFFFAQKKFRLHLMPIAVGIYLPLTLATPMVIGGVIHYFVKQKHPDRDEGSDPGVLLSSGLVAGEALMGVLVAGFIGLGITLTVPGISEGVKELASVAAFALLAFFLLKKAKA